MSKIGNSPIPLTAAVKVTTENRKVSVQGPLGKLSFNLPPKVELTTEDSKLVVTRQVEDNYSRSLHGTCRAILANMVKGVTEGFTKNLSLVGVGYRAEVQGEKLTLQLGYSHPIVFIPPPGIKMEAAGGVKISISGADKQLVGLIAAKIRSFRPPEPYKGKGIRYTDEHVRKKAGKTAA